MCTNGLRPENCARRFFRFKVKFLVSYNFILVKILKTFRCWNLNLNRNSIPIAIPIVLVDDEASVKGIVKKFHSCKQATSRRRQGQYVEIVFSVQIAIEIAIEIQLLT